MSECNSHPMLPLPRKIIIPLVVSDATEEDKNVKV
jgi:hypothetical protein